MANIEQILLLEVISSQLAEIQEQINKDLLKDASEEEIKNIGEGQTGKVKVEVEVTRVAGKLFAEPTSRLLSMIKSLERTLERYTHVISEKEDDA